MSDIKQIFGYVNTETCGFVGKTGSAITGEGAPAIDVDRLQIWCLALKDAAGAPVAYDPALDVFDLIVKLDFDDAKTKLVTAANAKFCLPGDWADCDPATGKISIRIDARTEELEDALGQNEKITVWAQITRNRAGNKSTVLLSKCVAKNNLDQPASDPTPVGPHYYTADEVDALVIGRPATSFVHGGVTYNLVPVEDPDTGVVMLSCEPQPQP